MEIIGYREFVGFSDRQGGSYVAGSVDRIVPYQEDMFKRLDEVVAYHRFVVLGVTIISRNDGRLPALAATIFDPSKGTS